MSIARVVLWGRDIGAVSWDSDRLIGNFEYTPEFLNSNVDVSPIVMPKRQGVFNFPGLSRDTFKGLPGLLADSLPDKFGNQVIDNWLARQGRQGSSMNPVERLCYTGTRGMGALEFLPQTNIRKTDDNPVDILKLVNLASEVLQNRENLSGHLDGQHDEDALKDILHVGTSAGGARAKAVLAWNPETKEFRSGQVETDKGFQHWLMKFDGVAENRDKELADPMGYGRLEYACYLMAKEAGINMKDCRLHEEGGRAHFMTRRFDRTASGGKIHMQSLCALRHYDFNASRAYSYEQAIQTARILGLPRKDIEEQVLRAYFNIAIRNQDDHTKNIAYLMDKRGTWSLAPAFDVVYAYNPDGQWTAQHQMSLSGKTDGFDLDDLIALGRFADIKPVKARKMIEAISETVAQWDRFCDKASVSNDLQVRARRGFRTIF